MIRSFADIFTIWSIKELSDRLPVKYPTAAAMKQREWISSAHWGRLIEIARQDGHMLDAEMLLAFARQRGPRSATMPKAKPPLVYPKRARAPNPIARAASSARPPG